MKQLPEVIEQLVGAIGYFYPIARQAYPSLTDESVLCFKATELVKYNLLDQLQEAEKLFRSQNKIKESWEED